LCPGPDVPEEAVARCRVFPNRYAAIRSLATGGTVGEVGTQTGRFAAFIDEVSAPTSLHLFDLTLQHFEVPALRDAAATGRVVFHVGDSSRALAGLPAHTFDWIYIDGDHSYAGVRKDIDAAVRAVKPDGVLVFNDYTSWSPVEAQVYGVLRAVNELLAGGEWEMTYLAIERSGYHDVALRRRAHEV
jgi:SAM-dependent methyltransferase